MMTEVTSSFQELVHAVSLQNSAKWTVPLEHCTRFAASKCHVNTRWMASLAAKIRSSVVRAVRRAGPE